MAPPEKPSRLGRGLDALLARKEPQRPQPIPATSAHAVLPANALPDNAPTPAPVPGDGTSSAITSSTPDSSVNSESGTSAGFASGSLARTWPNPTGLAAAGAVATGHLEAATTAERPAATSKTALATDTPSDTGSPYADAPTSAPTDSRKTGYHLLSIAHIAANRFQPRKEFREDELAELEASLRLQGLMQPITVRPAPEHTGYELIAGERRLRAATRLGWKEIPAIVRETNDRTMLTLAMVENLQRADLDPIDEADGYQRLIDDFELTQQEVADVVGKERSTIANALRLLALPASVKRMLQDRHITVGHARALLPLETERAIADLARDVVAQSLSVRDVELRVRNTRPNPAKSGRKAKAVTNSTTSAVGIGPAATAELRRIEELLRKKLQTTVALHLTAKDKGEVRIAFFSNDDLERVLQLLGINLDH